MIQEMVLRMLVKTAKWSEVAFVAIFVHRQIRGNELWNCAILSLTENSKAWFTYSRKVPQDCLQLLFAICHLPSSRHRRRHGRLFLMETLSYSSAGSCNGTSNPCLRHREKMFSLENNCLQCWGNGRWQMAKSNRRQRYGILQLYGNQA